MIKYKVLRADVAIRENSEMLKELGAEGWELKGFYLDLAVFMKTESKGDPFNNMNESLPKLPPKIKRKVK